MNAHWTENCWHFCELVGLCTGIRSHCNWVLAVWLICFQSTQTVLVLKLKILQPGNPLSSLQTHNWSSSLSSQRVRCKTKFWLERCSRFSTVGEKSLNEKMCRMKGILVTTWSSSSQTSVYIRTPWAAYWKCKCLDSNSKNLILCILGRVPNSAIL